MSDLVVDASAFVKLLVRETGTERMLALASEAERFIAPDHLLVETTNTLWKKVRWQALPAEDALDALNDAERYPLELTPVIELLAEALGLACELPHPPYDMLYLLLALRGGHPLATADSRLREAAGALGIRVQWVGAD